ncbi:MAG: hypothetical protein CMN30_15785 [Sandaracinus sp.]|nr:hypothetical protein [Sandaracinus sp.]|tara:strand:- start:2027 stop:2716 length:690 start_codon:yes stop_codon:yes gene_type:complete
MVTRFSVVLALLLMACGPREGLHPVTPPDLEPPPGDAPGVANDPVRQDYRVVLAECDDQRQAMEGDVGDAENRRREQTAVAAAVYAVGEATDVRDDSDVPTDGVGGQAPCPQDRDPNRAGPCIRPTPTVGTTGAPSPAQSDEDAVRSDAHVRMNSIETAVDEADEFLFAHPDTTEWTDGDRAEWTTRRNRLAQLCGYTAAGPTGPAPEPEPEPHRGPLDLEPEPEPAPE